jgi:hypothetical protein
LCENKSSCTSSTPQILLWGCDLHILVRSNAGFCLLTLHRCKRRGGIETEATIRPSTQPPAIYGIGPFLCRYIQRRRTIHLAAWTQHALVIPFSWRLRSSFLWLDAVRSCCRFDSSFGQSTVKQRISFLKGIGFSPLTNKMMPLGVGVDRFTFCWERLCRVMGELKTKKKIEDIFYFLIKTKNWVIWNVIKSWILTRILNSPRGRTFSTRTDILHTDGYSSHGRIF